MSDEVVEVKVPVPDPTPVVESSPVVVVTPDSGESDGAVEAVVVESQIDMAGKLAQMEMLIAAQSEEIALLHGRTAVAEAVAGESATAAQDAAAAAAAAAEPPQAPAEDDDPPNNEHPWFRKLGR